jgi:hypothetical protein
MSMRPFWVETLAGGRQTPAATGPRAKDGRCSTNVYVELDGCSTRIVQVECFHFNGKKRVRVNIGSNVHLVWREEHKFETLTALLTDTIPEEARETAVLHLQQLLGDVAYTLSIPRADLLADLNKAENNG